MRVLLTGARGILAKNLLPLLLADDSVEKVVGITRKARQAYYYSQFDDRYIECYSQLERPLSVNKLLCDYKPDVVFNFAATSTANSPADTVWKNTNITLNLLEASKERPTKFIQASSIVIDNQPQSIYSTSKKACEDILESYKQLYKNITGFSFRTCGIVGAGNNHGLLKDIVRKVLAEGNSIELFGNEPGSVKPFVYARDLVQILYDLYQDESIWGGSPFTISPKDSISVKNVVEIVMSITGKHKDITWNNSKVWLGDQRLVQISPNGRYFGCYLLNSIDSIRAATLDIIQEEYSGK